MTSDHHTNPNHSMQQIGVRNLRAMYLFTFTSRLWLDGGLWVIYLQHKDITLVDIGLLEALLHVTALISDVPIGLFADRFGWKRTLALGTLLGVIYTTFALWGTNIWWFAAAFAGRGLQLTMTSGSDASVLYESAVWANRQKQYLKISGRVFAIMLVSLGVAEAAGGVLAHWSWAYVYIGFTVANLISFVLVTWFIKEPRAVGGAEVVPTRRGVADTDDTGAALDAKATLAPSGDPAAHPSLPTIARNAWAFARARPAYVRWLGMSAVLSGFVAVFGFYGQALLQLNGWTLVGIGILMGAENGFGALVAMWAHRLVGRAGESATVLIANLAAAVGLLLFAFIPGVLSGIGYLLDSTAVNLADPVIDQGLNRLVPTEQRATLLSAHSTSFSVFMMIVFPIFGAVASHIGLAHTAWLFSIIGAVSIILTVTWWLQLPRQSARSLSLRQRS